MLSKCHFVNGMGKILKLQTERNLEDSLKDKDFVFIFKQAQSPFHRNRDLKSKIKLIEDFDVFVGEVVKKLSAYPESRICVTSDYASSLTKKSASHGQVPFVIRGSGIKGDFFYTYKAWSHQ